MAKIGTVIFEMGANVNDMMANMKNFEMTALNFVSRTRSLLGAAAGIAGVGSFGAVINSWLQEAAKYEQQEIKLASALRSRGVESVQILSILKNQAERIQNTTIFSEKEALEAQRFAINVGVLPSQIDQVLHVAAKVASFYDMELKDAVQNVSLAMEGMARGLRKIDPQLAAAAKNAKSSDDILKLLNERFGQDSSGQIETYAKKVKKFENASMAFKKEMGKKFIGFVKYMVWHFTQLLKTPHLFMPGELQQVQDLIHEALDFADALEKGDPQLVKLRADKYFEKRKREVSKDIANLRLKLQKETNDAKLKLAELYGKKAEETYALKVKKAEDEWKYYEKAGIERGRFDELMAVQKVILWQESINKEFANEKEIRAKMYDAAFPVYKEEEKLRVRVIDANLAYLIKYSQTMQSLKQQQAIAVEAQVSGISPATADLMKVFREQETGKNPYSEKEKLLRENLRRVESDYKNKLVTEDDYNKAYKDWMMAAEVDRYSFMGRVAKSSVNVLTESITAILSVYSSKNWVMFEIFKYAQRMQTFINTQIASCDAFWIMWEKTENPYAAAAAASAVQLAGQIKLLMIEATYIGSKTLSLAGQEGYNNYFFDETIAEPQIIEEQRIQQMSVDVYTSKLMTKDELMAKIQPELDRIMTEWQQ